MYLNVLKLVISSVENTEGMFISEEKILLLTLSVVERKDLVYDDQHGGGRAAGHTGVRYQLPISEQTALCQTL